MSWEVEPMVADRFAIQRRIARRSTVGRGGFSLVELMAVIVIIGLLAATVTVGVRSYMVAGKQNAARMNIARFSQALESYYSVHDRYPSNDEGLIVLTQPTDKLVDGLIDRVGDDPWGRKYQYNNPGRKRAFEVICYGADGREGGTGADKDISSDDLSE